MKKTISEAQLRNIIAESVKNILKEGTSDDYMQDAWFKAEEILGAEEFNLALFKALNADQVEEILTFIDRCYELNLFNGDDEDEEY